MSGMERIADLEKQLSELLLTEKETGLIIRALENLPPPCPACNPVDPENEAVEDSLLKKLYKHGRYEKAKEPT